MIGWAERVYDKFNGKRYGEVPTPASLFFWDGETNGIDGLPFDLFISEGHGLDYSVSDHPLQDGTTVSDHVHRKLRKVSIKGMFTNHPMRRLTTTDADTAQKTDTVKIEIGGELVSATTCRARDMYGKLEALAEKRGFVRLVTSLVVYPKMVITSLTTDRDSKSGEAVTFSMELREIETVTLRQVSTSYVYSPDTFETAKDRLVAAKERSGRRSAVEKQADELRRQIDPEVFK